MTEERSLDELGPVDYLIVEFPAGAQNFTGEGAAELLRLHDAGTIRIMDILILQKGEDGTVMAQELGDLEKLGDLARLETQLVQTLAAEDVDNLAAAMDPGSVAGVLVYENVWAAPFASAMRRAGSTARRSPSPISRSPGSTCWCAWRAATARRSSNG